MPECGLCPQVRFPAQLGDSVCGPVESKALHQPMSLSHAALLRARLLFPQLSLNLSCLVAEPCPAPPFLAPPMCPARGSQVERIPEKWVSPWVPSPSLALDFLFTFLSVSLVLISQKTQNLAGIEGNECIRWPNRALYAFLTIF
jgi:hypothetical protein